MVCCKKIWAASASLKKLGLRASDRGRGDTEKAKRKDGDWNGRKRRDFGEKTRDKAKKQERWVDDERERQKM